METKKPKCSSDKELDAIVYCGECKIYMCSKCEQFHSKLLSAHQTMNLDKEDGEIFTGICKEPNHGNKLEFFLKIIILYVVFLVQAKSEKKDLDYIKIVMFAF